MMGMKSNALLLLLSVPLTLYCAVQGQNIARSGGGEAAPQTAAGATGDQLVQMRAKAAADLIEVRKATAVTWQFRAAGAEDTSSDKEAAAVIQAAAARAANLNDLDLFLSDIERPEYRGRLNAQYEKWMKERRALKRDVEAVNAWLARPPTIASAADAQTAADAIDALIAAYVERSRFADRAAAAIWRVRARLAIIDALTTQADIQYRAAVQAKLPLAPGTNAVKIALDILREQKVQITLLEDKVRQLESELVRQNATVRAAINAKAKVAIEATVREELLGLFAKDDLFTNPAGASTWLDQVGDHYRKTQEESIKTLIRQKVQEYCEAFLPQKAKLDEEVMLKGKPVLRRDVTYKFQATIGGKTERRPLSGEIDGVNEFNLLTKHPGETTFVEHMGSEEYPRDLKPTKLSEAAVQFSTAREQLAERMTQPKWNAESLAALKKRCEPFKELVDKLQSTDGMPVEKETKIWTRLNGLEHGMINNPELFTNRKQLP